MEAKPAMDSSIERKIAIGFALGPIMLVVIGIIAIIITSRLLQTQASLLASYDVRGAAQGVIIDLLQAESGQRGYLLTGKPAYLDPYHASLASLDDDLAVFTRLYDGNAERARRAAIVRSLSQRKVTELKKTIALRKSHHAAAALALVQSNSGKGMMHGLRATMRGVLEEEWGIIDAQSAADRRTVALAWDGITYGTAATILALVLLGFFAMRELKRHGAERTRAMAQIDVYAEALEGRVQASDDKFRGFLTASPDAMLVMDENSTIILASERVEHLFGYDRDELIGQALDMLVPERVRDELAAYVAEIIRVPSACEPGLEQFVLRKDGAEVLTEIRLSAHQAPDGLVLVAAIRDITLRKRMEAALQQSQKMEAVGQLTSGVAHDFNNLLGGIIGNLDLLTELVAENPQASRYTEQSLAAALSGAELVKRMLAFSRRQPLRLEPLDLRQTIAAVVPLIQRTLSEQITIVDHVADDLWFALADRSQIENAVLNLALNARDAMPDGGALTIDCRNMTIDEEIAPSYGSDFHAGDYVIVSVTDTGHGMTPDVLACAFDPFYTTKKHGVGTGLGLSMVLGTMKQSGGTARIYSELEHGTMVRLYLPRTAEMRPHVEAGHNESDAPLRGTERVLVVEDNERVRETSCAMLTSLGYRVEAVDNAEEALMRVNRGDDFDLVFSDVVMPGFHTGLTLARALHTRDPKVKVILTSGYMNPTKFQDEIRTLGIELISKPFRKVELAALLRDVLDRNEVVAR